jgi:hypothetical protein
MRKCAHYDCPECDRELEERKAQFDRDWRPVWPEGYPGQLVYDGYMFRDSVTRDIPVLWVRKYASADSASDGCD